LVVTPTKGRGLAKDKFVASPDGQIRGLNVDEQVLQEHQRIKPRRRPTP
jgi:hypothetical protein